MAISREKKLKALLHSFYGNKRRASRWLYFSVAVFAVLILALWGWAMGIRISSINWENSAEKQMAENVKRDWNQIFSETKERETLKQKVSGILSKALSAAALSRPIVGAAPNANMTGSPTSAAATVKAGD